MPNLPEVNLDDERVRASLWKDADSVVAEAIDSMGGFSLVLANAKAFLEHNIDLKLIPDHAPDSHVTNDVG